MACERCAVCKTPADLAGFFVGTADAIVCAGCMNDKQKIVLGLLVRSILKDSAEAINAEASKPTEVIN